MLARRDQSNQIEHSINQIQSNPVKLNHMLDYRLPSELEVIFWF